MNKLKEGTRIDASNLIEDREYILKGNGAAVVKLLKKEESAWLFEVMDGELSVGGQRKRKTARVTIGVSQLPMASGLRWFPHPS